MVTPRTDPSRYNPTPSVLDALLRPTWMRDAHCVDYDLDFIEAERTIVGTAAALQICGRCSVREACLEYALADPSLVGIWGGADSQARRSRRRSREMGSTSTPVIRSTRKPQLKESNP